MGGKGIAVVILVVVVVAAIIFAAMRLGVGGPQPPDYVTGEMKEMLDVKTGDLITDSVGEWVKRGPKDGFYKNPKTGKYTMVLPMDCSACGEKIPPPKYPADALQIADEIIRSEEMRAFDAAYVCPKCGEQAISWAEGGIGE